MGKEWISTFKLLHYLYDHPNKEKECRLYLGSCLASTHYCFLTLRRRSSCTLVIGILSLSP